MKKWLIITGSIILATLVLVSVAWLWLTRSESGARFALARVAGAVEQLEYDRLSGGFASGLSLDGVEFAQAGSRVTAAHLELAVRVELLAGPQVVVDYLRVREIDIHLPPPGPEGELRAEPFDLSRLASPVTVEVREVDVSDLTIHSGSQPQIIERIELAGRYGRHLVLDRLEVTAAAWQASASGQWALARAGSGRLQVAAETGLDADTSQSARLEISGRLDALDIEMTASGPARLAGQGRVRGLPGSPRLEASLNGAISGWPGVPVAIENLELTASGQPDDWQARTSARVSGPDLPPGAWALALSGSRSALRIDELETDILDGRITGSGSLDWSESAPLSRARIEFADLDLTALYPDWPNQGRLGGELVASSAGGAISIETLEVHARPGKLDITGSGQIDPAADALDVTLQWQHFAWPPVSDDSVPLVASESGELRLAGRISDWRLELEALITSPEMPDAHVEARATGSRQAADIERLDVDAGEDGSLAITGQITWAPTLGADIELLAEHFNPGLVVAELSGQIDAQAHIGFAKDRHWRVNIELDSLGGRLRGQPLAGSGRLAVRDERPQDGELELALGDNRISLGSGDGQVWQVTLDALALEQLWPGLEGQARLAGEVRPEAGTLSLDGQISEAGWQAYFLQRAELVLRGSWLDEPEIDLSLTAEQLDLRPWDRVESLELTLKGGCQSHRLNLATGGSRGQIDVRATGELAGCLDGAPEWRGQLVRFYLGDTAAGDWRLTEPLPIAVSAGTIDAGPGCLTTAADTPARLCLDSLVIDDNSRLTARVASVPMDLLLLPMDPLFSLTTPLSGQIEAGWDSAGLTALEGHLEWDSGALRARGDDTDLLSIDVIRLDFQPDSEQALDVLLHAQLEGNTEINGRARLASLRDLTDARIDGEARIDLPDVAAFGHLVPRLDKISGRASGRIEAAGPLTRPSISGRLTLEDGRIAYAPLGLDVHAIALELSGSSEQAHLSGRAEAGDGHLTLEANAGLGNEGWQLDGHLDGEQFAFAGADWLRLTASPNVRVQAWPDRVAIDGDIHIDRLRGGLPPGTAERIEPSPDIEVIGEEDENGASANADRRQLNGRLAIDLGKDARLTVAGLDTELAGGLELHWSGPPRPQGRGTIRLPEGSYREYGQTLEIADGEIIFTGHPIDDPRLDIRAVRDIFGDSRVRAAGVHITGSARRPHIEIYTDPPTSQEKALAYVVTGSDFDHVGGQGMLNVGFYLLPRLFVSYGLGLFETGNVLSGRYEFSPHWGVRVVSGERDTGVDLSYTVDN